MGTRSTARKLALQLLFQMNEQPEQLTEEKIDYFLKNEAASSGAKKDALDFISGIAPHLKEIDKTIEKHSQHWSIKRISRIDHAILRLALFELKFLKETPEKVVINEALELSKKFSSEDSFAFINGVLDGYLKEKKE